MGGIKLKINFLMATSTMITLPVDAVEVLLAHVGTLFTDLWALIALAIGIPLAFYIIGKVVSLVRGRTR